MTRQAPQLRVAAQPIGWSNDDFRDLGGDIPLERCLGEMKEAGYEGTELGHKFPREEKPLRALLERYGLALASAWHSTYLLSRPLLVEESSWMGHVALLKAAGAKVAIAAECTGAVYGQGGAPRPYSLEAGPGKSETFPDILTLHAAFGSRAAFLKSSVCNAIQALVKLRL